MNSGSAAWKRMYRRLRSMSAPEITDRLRQHAGARIDWLRHKAGSDFASNADGTSHAQAHFFFSPDQVSGLCSRLRELFPEAADQIIGRAERICKHRFDLLGYGAVDYGSPIDWQSDRVHHKRAPRKPWFSLKYLDFDEVGDSKITWELNRHQHFVTLAKAFRLSGDPKYASELFAQWHHWHLDNPYPIGINWASSLEVAFRSLSWLWTYFLIADSPATPSTFRESWLRALAVSGGQARTVERCPAQLRGRLREVVLDHHRARCAAESNCGRDRDKAHAVQRARAGVWGHCRHHRPPRSLTPVDTE